MQIDMVIDPNWRRHITPLWTLPSFRGSHVVFFSADLVHIRAVVVTAGKDRIVKNGRRQNIHAAIGGDLLRPENITAVQINARQSAASLNQNLLPTRDRGDQR